jgi:hypothetical protein
MANNVYSLEKALKSKKKSESQVSQDVAEEAEKIERQNYDRAKNMRKRLDESSLKQKATTAELQRQGETMESAKEAAVGINVGAKKGAKLTEDIEREGHIFTCGLPCIQTIKSWFKKDEGNIEDIVNKKEPEHLEEEKEEEPEPVEFDEDQEEYIKGQKKTDKEMVNVLGTVRSIRREADKQNKEIARQKSTVKDISTITERSENVIKKTDEQLRKVE